MGEDDGNNKRERCGGYAEHGYRKVIELGKYVPDECLNGMIIREQPLYHASSCKFASWCSLEPSCVGYVHFIAHLTYYLNPPPLQQGGGFFYMS